MKKTYHGSCLCKAARSETDIDLTDSLRKCIRDFS